MYLVEVQDYIAIIPTNFAGSGSKYGWCIYFMRS